MSDEAPRYTLEEARKILRREECRLHGHDVTEVRALSGTVSLYCEKCGVHFVPQEE